MGPRPIDKAKFPALAEYLERLPAGLASYPEAQTLGLLLKSAVAPHYFHASWKELPPELMVVLRSPPLPTAWVSTVLTDAVFCVVADTFHPTREAVLKWSYERTLRLTALPMYATLTKLAGVERFLRTAVKIHALFQRGTDVSLHVWGEEAEVRLTHPPHLHGELNHLSNEAVFRAVLESAGALDVTMRLRESRPEGALYVASWRIPRP